MDSNPTKSQGNQFVPRLMLALVATLVALGSCELAARMILPPPPDAFREPQIVFRYDPEIRYVYAPSQKGWIDDGFVTINSLGFRGAEVATPKPAGRFRVVIIGDSVTLGWGVADDETFSARLEQLMRQKFPQRDVDVVDLGVGGYDTRQEVALLKRNLSVLEPDLVLVGFYSNDVPDAAEDQGPSGGGGTTIAAANPQAGQILHMNPTPSSWLDRQARKSRALYAAGRAFKRLTGRGEWGMARYSMELDMLEGRSSPAIDRAWDKVATHLEELRALGASHGFRVGIVTLPCREQVSGEYPNAQYQSRIRAIAERLGFFVVDPLPGLTASPLNKKDLYIPYDRNHPSVEGHRIIAESILADLSARASADGAGAWADPAHASHGGVR